MGNRELTLENLLADPMTLAVMAADNVDPGELKIVWTALAQRLALLHEAECRSVWTGWDDWSW
jgi:hypothetical protein